MSTQMIEIKDEETKELTLSPVAFMPAMSFPISNATGVDIRVIVDGKKIRIEKQ